MAAWQADDSPRFGVSDSEMQAAHQMLASLVSVAPDQATALVWASQSSEPAQLVSALSKRLTASSDAKDIFATLNFITDCSPAHVDAFMSRFHEHFRWEQPGVAKRGVSALQASTHVGTVEKLDEDLFLREWFPLIAAIPEKKWSVGILVTMYTNMTGVQDWLQRLPWATRAAQLGHRDSWLWVAKRYRAHGLFEFEAHTLRTIMACEGDNMRHIQGIACLRLIELKQNLADVQEWARWYSLLYADYQGELYLAHALINRFPSTPTLLRAAAILRKYPSTRDQLLALYDSHPALFSVYTRLRRDATAVCMDEVSWRASSDECVVCQDQTPCVGLLPCRHRVLCADCLSMTACPVCREPVQRWNVPHALLN